VEQHDSPRGQMGAGAVGCQVRPLVRLLLLSDPGSWCGRVVVDVRLCLWYFALLGGGGADERAVAQDEQGRALARRAAR